jgi:hypothetical protein
MYNIYMQFKVPQFIDIEDKVVGPLTIKQFAYLAGGAGFAYLSFRLLPGILALVISPVFAAFGLLLAFFKYNEKPFINLVYSFVRYYSHDRLYLWQKKQPVEERGKAKEIKPEMETQMTDSKLKTLSWSLDVIDIKK